MTDHRGHYRPDPQHSLVLSVHGLWVVQQHHTCCGRERLNANACVDMGWKPTGLPQEAVLIVGDAGEAIDEVTMTRGESSCFRLIEKRQVIIDETRSPYDDDVESFYSLQHDVVEAWEQQSPVPQSARDNLSILQTKLAAYEAIDTNRPTMLCP